MGIPGLRSVIEACEEIVPLAQLAQDCWNEHQRPFRIAVDAADWHFHNISPAQERSIRSKESAANPIEKAIFFRVCNLLTLNIRPVFVFDGSHAPLKRNATEGRKISPKARVLIEKALDGLGVSRIDAPGEAEADCCRLQTLGLVDAVWSQDSDCLMFGCTFWIRELRTAREAGNSSRHVGDTQKDPKRVRVVRAEKLKIGDFQLKPDGCVLFAMLVGADYDTRGLPGCGIANALKLVKASLGRSLCSRQNQQECDVWSERILPRYLATQSITLVVPKTFPRFDTLQNYANPRTLGDAELRERAAGSSEFNHPPREEELLGVACRYFNFWSKKYYNHIGPVLLSRYLAERDRSLPRELVHDIKLVKTKSKGAGSESDPAILERKLTFSPFGVSRLNKAHFEPLYSTRPSKTDTSFDPEQRVTCEIPTFLLQKVLPLDVLEPPAAGAQKQTPKRKQRDDAEQGDASHAKKRGRPRKKDTAFSSDVIDSPGSRALPSTPYRRPLATPNRDSSRPSATRTSTAIEFPDSEDEQIKEAKRRSLLDVFHEQRRSFPGIGNGESSASPRPSMSTPSRAGPSTLASLPREANTAGPGNGSVASPWNLDRTDFIDLTED